MHKYMIIVMQKSNLQIRIPEDLQEKLEGLVSISKSEFVRQAIEEKIQREKDRKMEEHWIHALSRSKNRRSEDPAWEKAQSWTLK